jgi:hypothetical protein
VDTRIAMLEGVRSNDIIVGAYTSRSGGICPMLAAHRHGGRTSLLSFARSWDRFTRARGRARRASERELRVLTAHLEASLLAEHRPDLERAIVEHRDLISRRSAPGPARLGLAGPGAAARPRPGDPDRARELRSEWGWAWLRPFRRLDEYEHAVAQAEAERDRLYDQAREREPASGAY